MEWFSRIDGTPWRVQQHPLARVAAGMWMALLLRATSERLRSAPDTPAMDDQEQRPRSRARHGAALSDEEERQAAR
jgi:hypothetical protein